jgi:hypothetical protein
LTVAVRFVLQVLLITAAIAAAVGGFNYWVDPYQQYRIPARYEPRFYNAFQRYVNPGMARHYDYDRVSIGSSLTENIANSEVDAAFGSGRTINLALSAMTSHDARKLLEVALDRGTLKQVLYTLDFNSFSGPVDRSGFPDPLPTYLYDRHAWNDLPYLLSVASLVKSLEIVRGERTSRFSTDRDRPWAWSAATEFGARKVVANLDPGDLNKRFKQPPRTIDEMMASLEANLLPLVRDHPKVRFIFTWPPYSRLVWADFHQRGQLEVSLEFKRRLFRTLGAFPNVSIHDFQSRTDIIEDLSRYTDIYHYGSATSSYLVKAVARDAERVTPENLEAGIARLRSLATTRDAAALIATALQRR